MQSQREGRSAGRLMTRFCVLGAGSSFLRKPHVVAHNLIRLANLLSPREALE